mmetsp:Transcript_12446/g.34944  ORF Transcript_12446/g.34944 Transcript_12446/m.34944 type:complete len:236 (+) Transcript_12446:217-924(+)|eukprot:CAMPEP_0117648410 /NCGR_PEP_ID=MMETSP0804-20121206/386_1 /TAXON_ID=1074897 /ORGANISM="Tetraselmis astigmatica, Strain CCMP880" /LENGTH=235 /DNA_ID=CAMNT_0005454003 /DNA_START=213 /DNA_END=920 /DNA_ORIENTATION=-
MANCHPDKVPLKWKLTLIVFLALVVLGHVLRESWPWGSDSQLLKAQWSGALEGWRDVPGAPAGKTLYLCPVPVQGDGGGRPEWQGDRQQQSGIPESLQQMAMFAITAWNPAGRALPAAENQKRNMHLGASLATLGPKHMWRSFGFDLQGYRENGYTVAVPKGEADSAREHLVQLAHEFGQSAIYEFWLSPGKETLQLHRAIVPVGLKDVAATTAMALCEPPHHRNSDPYLYFADS